MYLGMRQPPLPKQRLYAGGGCGRDGANGAGYFFSNFSAPVFVRSSRAEMPSNEPSGFIV